MIAFFLALRSINSYGDPFRWSTQASLKFTVLSFLNVTKYPPSLDFLLMTLGPALLALALFERITFSERNPLIVFGRVPLFYYVIHLLLAHLLSILLNVTRSGWKPFVFLAPPSMGNPLAMFPANYGYPLWMTYLAWALVLALIYRPCLWYANLKRRQRYWLLNYL